MSSEDDFKLGLKSFYVRLLCTDYYVICFLVLLNF